MNPERIEKSITRVFKTVFPDSANPHETLFGGKAMRLMDEVALLTATPYYRKKTATVSTDQIDFTMPNPSGMPIKPLGKVVKIEKAIMWIFRWLRSMMKKPARIAANIFSYFEMPAGDR